MADTIAQYLIGIGGDPTDLKSAFAAIKSQVRSDVAEISALTAKVELFGNLQANADKAKAALSAAKSDVDALTAALNLARAAGSTSTGDLEKALVKAQQALTGATREAGRTEAAVTSMAAKLQKAGVDTSNLASEQARLAAALKTAQAAAEQQSAQLALNARTLADVTPEIGKLIASYETLRTSGTLSTEQLAEAEGVLNAKIGELVLTIGEFGTVARAAGASAETLGATLRETGISAATLATEEQRLADQLAKAGAEAQVQSARLALGVRSVADIRAEITKLSQAYTTLRDSGTASTSELQVAAVALRTKTVELEGEIAGVGAAFRAQGSAVADFFTSIQAKVLGAVVAITAVAGAINDVVSKARDFNLGLTQISTVSNITEADLQRLGEGARTLARTIGFDVQDALKSLYEIIRAGVPPDNALAVLEAAAKAAEASLTDVGTTTKLTLQLINGFGTQISDLGHAFDVLFQGAHDGGATLAEFAAGFGPIAPLARSAGVSIEEVTAAIAVMTRAGLDAPAAFNDLGRVIAKLQTADAIKKLHDLGIEVNGLAGTFAQISAKGLAIDQIVDLGLSSQRSIAGVTALASASGGLSTEMGRLATATGVVNAAIDKLADTPRKRAEDLKAALTDLEVTWGNAIGAGSRYAAVLTTIVNKFNTLSPSVKEAVLATNEFVSMQSTVGLGFGIGAGLVDSYTSAQARAREELGKLSAAAQKAGADLQTSVGSALGQVTTKLAGVTSEIAETRQGLSVYVTELQAALQAIQTNTAASISDANTRAAAQIAALDRSTAAEAATAAQTIAIDTKLAADRLKIINDGAAAALAAAQSAAAGILKTAEKSATAQAAAAQQAAQLQLGVLATIKAQYQAHYNALVTQEQAFVAKLNSIDQTRVAFNEDVQQKLTEIRNEGLSDFDAYIARTNQINDLLGKAQRAFDQGGEAGLALGKTYTDQAIALTGKITQVVNDDGNTVISAFDAQQNKIGIITKAADQYNKALLAQKQAAQDGKEATITALGQVAPKLADITKQYDELNTKVQAGLQVKIALDDKAIENLITTLNGALAEKVRLENIKVDLESVKVGIDTLVANLKKGITEGFDAQIAAIAATLKKVSDEAPELKVKIDDALGQVDIVSKAFKAVSDLQATLTVKSNVADVQGELKDLTKPLETTLTVHVKQDGSVDVPNSAGGTTNPSPAPTPGFATGGLVPRLARTAQRINAGFPQLFAAGGPVFSKPSWSKVPGTGNGDTVPAALQAGSFVLRKDASRYYGDSMLGKLARGFAKGGDVQRFASGGATGTGAGGGFGMNDRGTGVTERRPLTTAEQIAAQLAADTAKHNDHAADVAPVIDPKLGYQPGDSFQGSNTFPDISFDSRPIPAALITAANVLAYTDEVFKAVGVNNPLLGVLATQIPEYVTKVESNPTDQASITTLLQMAETIGSNPYVFAMWGKTQSTTPPPQEWFYDWLEKTHAQDLANALGGGSGGGSGSGSGGSGTVGDAPVSQANTIGKRILSPDSAIAKRVLSPSVVNDFAKRFFTSPEFGKAFYDQNPLALVRKGSQLATIAAEKFAEGGDAPASSATAAPLSTDIVPAMLTPGEWVIKAQRVAQVGAGFMHALNNVQIPRETLARYLAPDVPMPSSVSYFADGGPVNPQPPQAPISAGANRVAQPGDPLPDGSSAGTVVNQDITNTITVELPNAEALFSRDNIKRYFVPAWNDIQKSTR